MLEAISDLPEGVVGLRASGTVSRQDYDRVVEPMLAAAYREGRRVRFLYHMAPEFKGFTPGAAWEDARIGMQYLRLFERCAIVSDKAWLRSASRVVGTLLPCPVKTYEDQDYAAAVAWLASPVAARSVTYKLIPESNVLLVEPHGSLAVDDFDAIAAAVDAWIDNGHELAGIVVHARAFPGWESLGSMLRHVRFVRDQQRRVRRVAIAVDGKLAKLAPSLVETFVSAQVQHFGYEELDRALEWAAGRAG